VKPAEVRAAIAQLAASQWGLITTAQATAAGASRMLLTRMTDNGELERVVYGVYAVPAASADEQLEKRALWLTLDPTTPAEERLARRHESGVLSHATAAALHGIGNILDDRVEITTPHRHQSRRRDLRLHRAELRPDETTYADGLPVTTAARTISDLVVAWHDRDHVADVLDDAVRKGLATPEEVAAALEERLGVESGRQVFTELVTTAGLDETSLERAVINTPIARRAIENMLELFADSIGMMELQTRAREMLPQYLALIDTSVLDSWKAQSITTLQSPEVIHALTAAATVFKNAGAMAEAARPTVISPHLVDSLQQFSRVYAHTGDEHDLTPVVRRAVELATHGPKTATTAESPNKPVLEEEDQDQ
jgi:hypothetical protein